MLDQQPVGAFAAAAVMAHAHEHPTAMQLFTVQREFQIALLVSAFRIVGFPIAAIPELHGAAAILALWNGAFEIAIVQRMIFHLHRQPLVMRIERGTLRHCPGFEDSVELQPQIVMQARRGVFLDHKPPALRRHDRGVAAGLCGLFEIPLFSIGGEVSERHYQIPCK